MNKFDKTQQPRSYDVEEWGRNNEGCFSFTSGRFIPTEDEGDYVFLQEGITWPGNIQDDVKDEKKERY